LKRQDCSDVTDCGRPAAAAAAAADDDDDDDDEKLRIWLIAEIKQKTSFNIGEKN